MELEEIKSIDNQLLKRKELVLKLVAESATPKKNEVLDKICSQYNVSDKNLVVLDSIKTSFGKLDCDVFAKIYESVDVLKATEPQPKKKAESAAPSNAPDSDGQIKVESAEPAEEKKEEKSEVGGQKSEVPEPQTPNPEPQTPNKEDKS
jgi:small subunit ribosomal protein S24e